MDKAALAQKVKNNTLRPKGRPTHRQAVTALQEIPPLVDLEGIEKPVIDAARAELLQVVAEYRRALKMKRWMRKKRKRG